MTGVAASRYAELEPDRLPYLDRGRRCARLTIPSLLPLEGEDGQTLFVTPHQSVGARGVNNMAAKLLLTLFPPNAPFMKFGMDEMTRLEVTEQEGMKAEVEKAFNAMTGRIMHDVEKRAIRTKSFEAFKQLLVAGNVLLYLAPSGALRVYRLDKFVVKRDPSGRVLEIIIKEKLARNAIPDVLRELIGLSAQTTADQVNDNQSTTPVVSQSTAQADKKDEVDLYTCIKYNIDRDEYLVFQEIEGKDVPGSSGYFAPEELPFLALRMVTVDGEDYGRGYIEEYLGDLDTLEALTQNMVEFTAIASRIVALVDPAGSTSVRALNEAANGKFVAGNAEDITFLQIEKYHDFQAVRDTAGEIERRLAFAFLMNTSIQRPGERVTAEEIRYMAQELEDALGGLYSLMAQDYQLPLANLIILELTEAGDLPALPEDVSPNVVTGLDAIGRGNDLSNLDAFIAGLPEPAMVIVDWHDYAQRRANALSVETDGLIKTREEIAQEQQQQQALGMIQTLGPNAVREGGKLMQQQMEPQEQAPNG